MDCAEVRIHVSALHDCESIPAEAAEHIRACNRCRHLLQDYAAMGTEMRLFSAELGSSKPPGEIRLPAPVRARFAWTKTMAARVRVPRFALALGIALIAGLAASLVLVKAQGRSPELWFWCELAWPQAQYRGPIHPTNLPQVSMAFGPAAKSIGARPFFITGPDKALGTVAGLMEVQGIEGGRVTLAIRVKRFQPGNTALEEAERSAPPLQAGKLAKILSGVSVHQFRYKPGTPVQIPVEGGKSLAFSGEIGSRLSGFGWQQFPLQPAPGQFVLDQPALVPERALLVRPAGAARVSGPDGCVYLYIPGRGLLILALHPFAGAHEAAVAGGHALFQLGNKWYYLFSELPMIGSKRPRTVWVYLARGYQPSFEGLEWDRATPFVGSAKDVTKVLDQLKKPAFTF